MIDISYPSTNGNKDFLIKHLLAASLGKASMALSVSLQHLSYHDAGLQGVSGAMVVLRRPACDGE